MKVTVNQDACEGHAKCQGAAPEVFEVRDDLSTVILDPVPESLRPKVERALRLCPRQAITISEG